jgi:hypothetical protein
MRIMTPGLSRIGPVFSNWSVTTEAARVRDTFGGV